MLNVVAHSKPPAPAKHSAGSRVGRLLTLAFVLAVAAGLCGLGAWQLDRAGQKRSLHAAYLRVATAPRVAWSALDEVPVTDKLWRAVAATGHYLPGTVLLDNRVRHGRVGYDILTPFKLASGPVVLVSRGWVPAPAQRGDGLALTPPALGVQTLAGRLAPAPSTGISLGSPQPPEAVEASRWRVQKIDFLALGAPLNAALEPYLLLLDDDQPDGYERQWALPAADDGKHTAYAVQWFTMSVVVLILAGYYRTRRHGAPPLLKL